MQNGSYTTLDALEQDVETASSEVLPALASNERTAVQLSLEDIKLEAKVLAFQKVASDLIRRERERMQYVSTSGNEIKKSTEGQAGDDEDQTVQGKEEDFPEGRTVSEEQLSDLQERLAFWTFGELFVDCCGEHLTESLPRCRQLKGIDVPIHSKRTVWFCPDRQGNQT